MCFILPLKSCEPWRVFGHFGCRFNSQFPSNQAEFGEVSCMPWIDCRCCTCLFCTCEPSHGKCTESRRISARDDSDTRIPSLARSCCSSQALRIFPSEHHPARRCIRGAGLDVICACLCVFYISMSSECRSRTLRESCPFFPFAPKKKISLPRHLNRLSTDYSVI